MLSSMSSVKCRVLEARPAFSLLPLLGMLALGACGGAAESVTPNQPIAPAATPVAQETKPPPSAPSPVAIALDGAKPLRLEILEAIDRGDLQSAQRMCSGATPSPTERESFRVLCDTVRQLADRANAQALVEHKPPRSLPAPPFAYTLVRAVPVGSSPPPVLRKLEEKKNAITDDEAWLKRNNLSLPTWEVPNPFRQIEGNVPKDLPARFGQDRLVLAIDQQDYAMLVFGPDFASGRFLSIVDSAHKPVSTFDFAAYLTPPRAVASDAQFVRGQIEWAVVRDNVLYVSTGHRTYAASSFGKNAFVTALDLTTGELLWQSDPLVSNARNFLILGDYIVSGYGFTAEPDFLFVLSRATGKTVKKIPVKSGPDYIFERGGKLFVRTYDTDYVFALDANGASTSAPIGHR